MPVLLSTAYFPPVEYFAAMAEEFTLSPDRVIPSIVYIEACENYQKQSYRNRCMFYSDSGSQSLTVPVIHENGTHKLPIKDLKVDYSRPWVRQHQRAIASAYGTSAYFEYYCDDLFSVMDSMPETLFALNAAIIGFFLKAIGLEADIRETTGFFLPGSGKYGLDLRETIHPKRKNDILVRLGLGKPYFQVFSSRYGFIPGLSVMDLLFNEGPDSILFLKRL